MAVEYRCPGVTRVGRGLAATAVHSGGCCLAFLNLPRIEQVDRGLQYPAPTDLDEWNARYPTGTPVIAYPGTRQGRRVPTRTEGPAFVLGGHTAVVPVDYGGMGLVGLTHVDVIWHAGEADGSWGAS